MVKIRRKLNKLNEEYKSVREDNLLNILTKKYKNHKNIKICSERGDVSLKNGYYSDIKILFNNKIIYIEEVSKYHFDPINSLHRTTNTLKTAKIEKAPLYKLSTIFELFKRQVINRDYIKYLKYKKLCNENNNIYVIYLIPEYINDSFLSDEYEINGVKINLYPEQMKIMYGTNTKHFKNFILLNDENDLLNVVDKILNNKK